MYIVLRCCSVIKLSLRLASGDTELFRRDEPLLMRDAVIVRKLGFGDIFIPGMLLYSLVVLIYNKSCQLVVLLSAD